VSDVEVNWYQHDVMVTVGKAERDFLLALGFQVEAEAKPNVPVDTGFLRNSSYVNGAGTNTFSPRSDHGHNTTPEPAQPDDDKEIVVGFAAEYAVYVEVDQPYLYPALQRVAQQANGTIEAAGRKHL
jgi:hypothetical protein